MPKQALKIPFTIKHTYLLTAFFLLLMADGLYAQPGYVPGYIILENNDTLYGKIKDRNTFSGNIFRKIRFKKKGERVKRYTAHDILGYYNGEHTFESVWYYEESEFLTSYYYSKPRYGQKVFLIKTITGPLNLYAKEFTHDDNSYMDSFPFFKREGDDYFVRATQGIFGLKKKKLARYFSDCPSLVNKIQEGAIKRAYEVADYYNTQCVK